MELDSKTNEFNDTIFYKNDSELLYQIRALEKLNSEYPNNDSIKNELKKCKAVIKNEEDIEQKLISSDIGMYVIRDLNVSYKDIKAQIDYIIITPGFIYLLECKSLYGNVYVNENGEFFKRVKKDKKVFTERMESPIKIVDKHKYILKKIWASKINSKDKMKFENAFERSYKTILVISNPKTVINLQDAPREIKEKIIKSDDLLTFIKKDLKKFQTRKELIDNKDEMHGQAYRLVDFHVDYNDNWEDKYKRSFKLEDSTLKHENNAKVLSKKKIPNSNSKVNKQKTIETNKKVNNKRENQILSTNNTKPIKKNKNIEIKKVNSNKKPNINNINNLDKINQLKTMMEANEISNTYYINLRKKLIKYRTVKSKQNQVPDYYVFTDEELEKLINKLPRSFDELSRKKILTPVKTKMFGADIIKIINS